MNKVFSTSVLGLVAIFIASFGDEVASVTFAFAQVDAHSMRGVSVLMSSALIGGLVAGPASIYLLNKFTPRRILLFVFILAGIAVFASASFTQDYWMYMASFVLGSLGSMFWSVLSVIIPGSFDEASLTDVNKVVHSIRNSGYILGPVLAGLLNANCSVYTSLIIIGMIFLCAAPFAHTVFRKKSSGAPATVDSVANSEKPANTVVFPDVRSFFRLKQMRITLWPLIITICTTSTFNVAFIHMLLVDLQYSEAAYGYLISALSFGLVIGPIALASMVQKCGIGFGACVCAAIIGLCLVLVGVHQAPVWLFAVLLVLGLANGIQNTLMSTFVMKAVPEHKRNEWMPTYMFIVQSSVLAGFIIGGLVPAQHAKLLLVVAGGIASIAGLIGAMGNFKESVTWNHSTAKIPADI